jgi:hypothetical protein
MSTRKGMPIVSTDYMCDFIKTHHKDEYWVMWVDPKTDNCVAMDGFKTIQAALRWDKENPPEKLPEGNFSGSFIFRT